MRTFARFSMLVAIFLFCVAMSGFGQDDPEAAAAVASGTPGYASVQPVDTTQLGGQLTIGSSTVIDADTGAVIGGGSGAATVNNGAGEGNDFADDFGDDGFFGDVRHTPKGGTIDGFDTVPTFDGAFSAQAGPSLNHIFRFTFMGNHPLAGDTTLIPAPLTEVSLQLLNADGSVFKVVSFAPFDDLTLDSPNFEEANYRSGRHLQYGDAIFRAQFFHRMDRDWHTILRPRVVDRITITVPFFVNVQLRNGTVIQARAYFTGTAGDGNTFVLMLSPLFNFFFGNAVVNEINNGNFVTKGLNMMLFPNTYLFNLNVNNPNMPGSCCVLGFHTYFRDPAATPPQPRYITQYASWISPGLFGAGFQDVTALSHETAEAFADPFVDNATPVWQFPGVPANAKICQGNLEEGDPIEVLPTATIPIKIRDDNEVFVYHPQIIPLLQWFNMGTTSTAIDGAYSFPDETTLPHSALPCPQ